MSKKVENGQVIKVHYKGTLSNGTMFDSSEGREPLQFTVGIGQVIKGFDSGVLDMAIGDKKTILIPCHEAYGPSNDEMKIAMPLSEVPQELNAEVGATLHLSDEQGQIIPVIVKEITADTIHLDANHPLADQDLTFDLELVEIVS